MHALNFDTFGASLMTSFTMLLVRKYPVLLEGTISCSGGAALWPMLYYFSFYIIVVCFLLNVFVAFILAVFNEVESVQRVDDDFRRQMMMKRERQRLDDGLAAGGLAAGAAVGATAAGEGGYVEDAELGGGSRKREMVDEDDLLRPRYRTRGVSEVHERRYSTDTQSTSRSRTYSGSTTRSFSGGGGGGTRTGRTYSDFGASPGKPSFNRSRGSIHLRGKVQELLLRSEDPYYSSTPSKDGNNRGNETNNEERERRARIILRSSGPKARDVEALMLKRHKASNSNGSTGSLAQLLASDLIGQQLLDNGPARQRAMMSLQNIASALGVDMSQIMIQSVKSGGGGGGQRGGSGGGSGGSGGSGSGSGTKQQQLSSRSVDVGGVMPHDEIRGSRTVM